MLPHQIQYSKHNRTIKSSIHCRFDKRKWVTYPISILSQNPRGALELDQKPWDVNKGKYFRAYRAEEILISARLQRMLTKVKRWLELESENA